MDKTKDLPLVVFCFVTFFVILPVFWANFEWVAALSRYHGFGRFGVLAYASVSMAAEGCIAKLLRLKEFFVPYFFALAICLFITFLMFCCADNFLIAIGAIAK